MKWFALIVGLVACGPATTAKPPVAAEPAKPAEDPPPPPSPKLVTVTVISAEIAGTMPNGQEWDAKDAKSAQTIDKAIAQYFADHPELDDTQDMVGIPIDAAKLGEEAKSSVAADPMVLVQIGNDVYRSPMRPRAFNPVWDFPFQFVYDPAKESGTVVRILVVDYDGPTRFDTIGAQVIDIESLLAKPVHELAAFGSVNKLVLQVATADLPASDKRVRRIAVPGSSSWTDAGIDVTAGQRITITAADEVCTTKSGNEKCSGPEGQRVTSDYNLPGFKKLGHGALVGALGDTRFAVKRERTLIAPSSGRLRLGVNDGDAGNNRGSYAVQITVETGSPAQPERSTR